MSICFCLQRGLVIQIGLTFLGGFVVVLRPMLTENNTWQPNRTRHHFGKISVLTFTKLDPRLVSNFVNPGFFSRKNQLRHFFRRGPGAKPESTSQTKFDTGVLALAYFVIEIPMHFNVPFLFTTFYHLLPIIDPLWKILGGILFQLGAEPVNWKR